MKKVFKILALITLILTILKITDTYAKYFTKATATKEQDVGQWKIMLNDDIDLYTEDGQTLEFTLPATSLVQDPNVVAGKIAPGCVWGTRLILDPTGTDVAIRYDIEVDPGLLTDLEGAYYQITLENEGKVIRKTAQDKFTGIISLSEAQAGQEEKILCSVVWENNDENSEEDTEFASTYGQQFTIPLKLTCTQYLGETLPPEYTE